MELIRTISGIRGIVNKNFNESIASDYAKSFCSLQNKGPIILARDTRNRGLEILNKIAASIASLGRDVYDCGIIPTPVIQFLVTELNASGGIMITASHNPEEWNGMKFIDKDGCFINSKKNANLLYNFDNNTFPKASTNKGEIVDKNHTKDLFINKLFDLKCLNIERIKNRQFEVVVDCINGANYSMLPDVLEKLNCKVTRVFCDNSGVFNRGAEPIPENLDLLKNKVLETNSDLGLASDPDGDRLSIVDNKGNAIGEENTLVLCANHYYDETNSKAPLVTNLSSTMSLDDIASNHDIPLYRSAVGEANVIELMKEYSSEIGGEGNGGVILNELHLGRDSLVASIMILNKLSKTDKSLNEIMQNIPQYSMIKDKIKASSQINLDILYDFLIKEYDSISYDKKDGLKLIWHDKWIHIRSSNTEPIIRIITESKTLQETNLLIEQTKSNINKFLIED